MPVILLRQPPRSCVCGASSVPTILSIGTTHPRNVAGVGRDIAVGNEYRCGVVTAIAAASAQDDEALRELYVLPGDVVEAQLQALAKVHADAIRVGALGSAENVRIVAEHLIARSPVPTVVDPVLEASTGGELIDEEGFVSLRDGLARLSNVILTPNLMEAAAFLGRTRIGESEMDAAARELRERGCAAVLLKGGHLDGDPVDVLVTRGSAERFAAPRIAGVMRGTGCTLAMAIACELAHGRHLRDAVVGARAYLREKMTANARGE